MSSNFNNRYDEYKMLVEQRLEECPESASGSFAGGLSGENELRDAMRYSLLAGGKRLRAVLTLAFCSASGAEPEAALDFAAAIEMMHAYSLIHDDLPCMDDDDFRRGKPSCHKVYGEWLALLAGDALQSEAYSMVLNAGLPAETRVGAAAILSKAAGCDGMCLGQFIDMKSEGKQLSLPELEEMYIHKTGAIIIAACIMGCAAADSGEQQALAAARYGASIALSFQIRDDMLDVISSLEEFGKPVGSDLRNQKATFVSHLGIQTCHELIKKETEYAKAAIEGVFEDTGFLCELADMLARRKY